MSAARSANSSPPRWPAYGCPSVATRSNCAAGFDETMYYTVEAQEADSATLRIDQSQIMYAIREKGRLCLREAGDDSAQCYQRVNGAD